MTDKNFFAPHPKLIQGISKYFLLVVSLVTPYTAIAADSYFFDKSHTEIRFYYDHGGVSEQSGEFGKFDGELIFDEDKIANSSVSVEIQGNSVSTGIRSLDGELKNSYYFSVKEHPTITFKSTGFEQTGDTFFKISGDLTIRGVSQPISLDLELRHKGEHMLGKRLAFYRGQWLGIKATTSFKRSDFGMKSYIPMISDLIRVEVNAELKKRKSN